MPRSSSRSVAGFSFEKQSDKTAGSSVSALTSIRLVSRRQDFPFNARLPRKRFHMSRLADGSLYVAWPNEGGYWIRPRENRIEYRLRKDLPEEIFWDSVEGPLVSFLLAMEGTPVFHGSAVKLRAEAVGFLGHSGAGKSTLAAALSLRGFPLVSDDLLRFEWSESGVSVWPGAGGIRLWPESGQKLVPDFEALPRVVPVSEKRKLEPDRLPEAGVTGPLPVTCLFDFERKKACRTPEIEHLSPRESWRALAEHLYLISYDTPGFHAALLKETAALARRVTVKRLVIPDDLDRLEETADFLTGACGVNGARRP